MSFHYNHDFVELVVHDVHGVAKGRIVTRKHAYKADASGEGLFADLCYVGIQGEQTVYDEESHKYGNVLLKPIPTTVVPSLRSANGPHRVGQVLCNLESLTGELDVTAPRTCAELQLDRLKKMGLTLKSSFEIEFMASKMSSPQVQAHASSTAEKKSGLLFQGCDMNVTNEVQEMMLDMMKEMSQSGVDLESFQTEDDQQQYEVVPCIQEGIEGPDMTARFKNWSKIFFKKRGYDVKYLSCLKLKDSASSFHWNHSLWDDQSATSDQSYRNETRRNVFIDAKIPQRLSEIGRHWLAGLVEHGPGINALCNPTVNCYRRHRVTQQPRDTSWGLDDRTTGFRLKIEGSNNTYIENRLPSSACNPYLVVAATVAAGMDGINRKLVLPPPRQGKRLAWSLEDALVDLEKDRVIVEALGPLVQRFVDIKRRFELSKFKDLGDVSDEVLFEKELEVYGHL